MILYNVTVSIDESVSGDWLDWMKNDHIPEVMSTGLFRDCKMYRLISGEEKNTFSIQYFLDSIEDYNKYINEHSDELRKKHSEKYAQKFVAFRTLLESVD